MPTAKPKTKSSKVFDVAKPAKASKPPKAAAIDTPITAPMIIKRAMVTELVADSADAQPDVMPAKSTKPSPVAPKESLTIPSEKLKIEPLSNSADLKPDTEKPASGIADEDDEKPSFNTSDDNDDESDNPDGFKDVTDEQQDVIDKKAAERQANFEKIVAAKTYFLPINQVVRRRSKRVIAIGAVLILLLGAAWMDVSLDAGLLTIPGVEAPTHFFSS